MNSAIRLNKLINAVKGKLKADNIDFEDYDKAIECLENCSNPVLCVEIYENYINY